MSFNKKSKSFETLNPIRRIEDARKHSSSTALKTSIERELDALRDELMRTESALGFITGTEKRKAFEKKKSDILSNIFDKIHAINLLDIQLEKIEDDIGLSLD